MAPPGGHTVEYGLTFYMPFTKTDFKMPRLSLFYDNSFLAHLSSSFLVHDSAIFHLQKITEKSSKKGAQFFLPRVMSGRRAFFGFYSISLTSLAAPTEVGHIGGLETSIDGFSCFWDSEGNNCTHYRGRAPWELDSINLENWYQQNTSSGVILFEDRSTNVAA